MSPDILPLEFGGHCGPLDNSHVVEAARAKEAYFHSIKNMGFTPEGSPEDENALPPLVHPFNGYCMVAEDN